VIQLPLQSWITAAIAEQLRAGLPCITCDYWPSFDPGAAAASRKAGSAPRWSVLLPPAEVFASLVDVRNHRQLASSEIRAARALTHPVAKIAVCL